MAVYVLRSGRRFNSSRRLACYMMNNMRRWSMWSLHLWREEGTVRDFLTGKRRKRRWDECIENNPIAWIELSKVMRCVAAEAEELQRFAEAMAEEINERRGNEGR